MSSFLTFVIPGVPRSVHRHFDTLAVHRGLQCPHSDHREHDSTHLDRAGVDCDDQVEALAPARPPHKPQVRELGHALGEVGVVVAQLRPVVLVIAGAEAHQGPVLYVAQADHLHTHC